MTKAEQEVISDAIKELQLIRAKISASAASNHTLALQAAQLERVCNELGKLIN